MKVVEIIYIYIFVKNKAIFRVRTGVVQDLFQK